MRQSWYRFAIVVGVGLLFLLSKATLAQTDDDISRAKVLFKKAEVHFSVGEFEQALELYRQAYKAKQLSAFLFNIAQCNRYLGRYKEAIFFYKRYLAQEPGTPHRSQVEAFIKECEERLAAMPPPETLQPPDVQRNPSASQPVIAARAPARDHRLATLLWSGVGIGGALLVTGAVTGIISNSKNQEYKDPATSIERRQELKDSGQALGITSVVMLGLGGGIAVATGAFYLFHYRRSVEPSVSFVPMVGSDGGQLVLGGIF